MRLAVTGGGTGGHIYPALEVARHARSLGDELIYLGSQRGQERGLCAQEDILFQGFPAQPLYSLRTPRGWRAAASLLRSVWLAKRSLKVASPDAVFSTGGYAAAPVIAAAKKLRIPYTLFEANSIPGRTHRMFAAHARAFASVFHKTAEAMHGIEVVRTGMPIRASLREAAELLNRHERKLLVLGGSQGSAFLNRVVPDVAAQLGAFEVLHAMGRNNFDEAKSRQLRPGYRQVPYLEQPELIEGYQTSSVALARSGGTVAEFALFRLPSVLVPLPTSADSHQLHNAREFADMDAATVLEERNADADSIAQAVAMWQSDTVRRERATRALAGWDVPDATVRIYTLISGGKLSQLSSNVPPE